MDIKENKPTNRKKINISEIFHYYQFIASILLKENLAYPSPIYGESLSKDDILDGWKKTVQLIKLGEAPKKFNLYVHIPFCNCKCLYCMSVSFRTKDYRTVIKKHIEDLDNEMRLFSTILKNLPVSAVYVGGGTPSLIEKEQIIDLFTKLKKNFRIPANSRRIFEASPFTLNREKLNALKNAEITELAIGVQSFDDYVLKKNRRPQTESYTVRMYKYAKEIKIPSITFDMMIGLPHQSEESSINSIKKAVRLRPEGILLNEFLPMVQTDFFLEDNTYSEKDVLSRNKVMKLAKKILKKNGYFSTRQGYRIKWTKKDEERSYETQESENLLGLGFGAFSHAYGSLKYALLRPVLAYLSSFEKNSFYTDSGRNLKKIIDNKFNFCHSNHNKQELRYFGVILNKKKEMNIYAYSNISQLSLDEFKNRFNEKFENVFKEQLIILKKLKAITIKNRKMTINKEHLHNFYTMKTLFMDKDYISKVLANSNEKYDPYKDYSKIINKLMRQVKT